jgi:hypothetical protein
MCSDVSSAAVSTAAASHGASSSAYQTALANYFEASPAPNTAKIARTAMVNAPSSATAAKPLDYTDSCQTALVRLYPDGRLVTAAMAQGPNGFGIARFGDEAPVETELPNLLLEPVTDVKAPRVLKNRQCQRSLRPRKHQLPMEHVLREAKSDGNSEVPWR